MDPRTALDLTIKFFKLKASDISKASGIDIYEISKYRHRRKDVLSVRLIQLINALPLNAQIYFWNLCVHGDKANFVQQSRDCKAS